MTQKKKINLFILLLLGFNLFFIDFVTGDIPFEDPSGDDWIWRANYSDRIIFHIEDNVLGDRYKGFNITNEPWLYENILNVWNLSTIEYDVSNNKLITTEKLFQVAFAENFWQLSFYDEMGHLENQPLMAFPFLPLNQSEELDLDHWGKAMTSYIEGTTYAYSLNLTEYTVMGNELHIYNSTTHHYVNMTYDINGTLQKAQAYVPLEMGNKLVLLNQTIWVEHELPSKNLLDDLDWGITVGDELYYNFTDEFGFSETVDYGKFVIESQFNQSFGPSLDAFGTGFNTTFYKLNQTNPDEYIRWGVPVNDEEPDKPYIEIGLQNEKEIFLGDGPYSLVFAKGTTGQNLNDSWGHTLRDTFHFDEFQVGESSLNCSQSYNDRHWYNISWNATGIVTYLSFNFTISETDSADVVNVTMRLDHRLNDDEINDETNDETDDDSSTDTTTNSETSDTPEEGNFQIAGFPIWTTVGLPILSIIYIFRRRKRKL